MSFAGAIEAGKAFVAFGVDTTQFERGLRRLQGRMKTFGASLQAQSAAIGTSLAFSALPFVAATKVFSDLEEKLTFVAAAAGKNLSDIPALSDAVRKLGRTTSFTASEVADAALAMARAGVSARDIPKALASVVAFSKATQLEMGRAAEVVTDTLNAFGLSFDQAGKAVDILTKTANSSSQTMEQLAEALSYTAPQAAALGISLEDTTALLGLLANSSIKASIAGTGLQRIMINMGKAAQQAKFKDLGIETVDKATGKVRSLADIIVDLNKVSKLKNLNDLQKANLFNELFGRGSKAALILARQVGNTSESFEKFKKKIESAKSAQDIQAELMKTTAGRLQLMKSAVLEAADAIGSAFGGAIAEMVGTVSKLTEDISELFRANTQLGNTIVKTTLAITAAVTVMFSLGLALKLAAVALVPFTLSMQAATWATALLRTAAIATGSASLVMGKALLATKATLIGVQRAMKLYYLLLMRGTIGAQLYAKALALSNSMLAIGKAAWLGLIAPLKAVYAAVLLLKGAFVTLSAWVGGPWMAAFVVGIVAIPAAVALAVAAFKIWTKNIPAVKKWFEKTLASVKKSISGLIDIWGGFFGRLFTSGKNIAIAFKTGDMRLMFSKIWNELKFVLMDFLVALSESTGQMTKEEADAYRMGLEADRAIGDQRAENEALLRNLNKGNKESKSGISTELADTRSLVADGDLLDSEKQELKAAYDDLEKSAKGLNSSGAFDDQGKAVDAEKARLKIATVEEKRAKLQEVKDKIAARKAKEQAEVQADLSGTGSENTPEGRAAKEQAAADARQKLTDLELRQKKNQLEIDKKRAGNIGSFERNLSAPSAGDIRGASGFNKLLTSQNNVMATAIQNVELAVREENLKMQELLNEQNKLTADIKKQNEEVATLDAELVP